MKKRVGAIEEFTFLPLSEGRQLHITIAITGWLASGKYRKAKAGLRMWGVGSWLAMGCYCGPVPGLRSPSVQWIGQGDAF